MTESSKEAITNIGAFIFFLLGVWVERSLKIVGFEAVPFVALLAGCAVLAYLLIKAEVRPGAILNVFFAVGITGMGFLYGVLIATLAYLAYIVIFERKWLPPGKNLAAASIAYLASHFFVYASVPVFVLALFGIDRVLEGFARAGETIKEILAPVEELIAYFFAGLAGYGIASYGYYLLLLPLAFFIFAAFGVKKRLYLPEAGYFLNKVVEGLDEVVFETPGATREIASLAVRMNDGDRQIIEKSAYLSALPWMKFNKTFYRQPEKVPAGTEAEMFRKAIVDVRDAIVEIGEKQDDAVKITSVYENFDGTGMPDGLEGENIPLEPQMVRVAEKYFTLTSWEFSEKPASDVEAIESIKSQAGSIYLPSAVEKLEKLILPVMEDSEQSKED